MVVVFLLEIHIGEALFTTDRRRGLGSFLLLTVARLGRAYKAQGMLLVVRTDNIGAMKFYYNIGELFIS